MPEYANVLQGNVVHHTCKSDAFITAGILHPTVHATAESLAKVKSGWNEYTAMEGATVHDCRRPSKNHILFAATPNGYVIIGYPSTILKPCIDSLSFFDPVSDLGTICSN